MDKGQRDLHFPSPWNFIHRETNVPNKSWWGTYGNKTNPFLLFSPPFNHSPWKDCPLGNPMAFLGSPLWLVNVLRLVNLLLYLLVSNVPLDGSLRLIVVSNAVRVMDYRSVFRPH
jgi:hypothetical protein